MSLNWQNSPRRSNVQRFRHCRRAARPVAEHPAGTRGRLAKVCARIFAIPLAAAMMLPIGVEAFAEALGLAMRALV